MSATSPAWAQTSVSQTLEMGKELYLEGRYADALAVAQAAQKEELSENNQLRALELEALSQFLLGERRSAQDAWTKALKLDPQHRLDPVEHSPEIIEFFERVSARAAAEEIRATEVGTEPNTLPDSNAAVQNVSKRGCGVVLCLIPFGGGQFANRRPGKGVAFALLQAATLATNIGLYYAREGNVGPNGFVLNESKEKKQFATQQVFFGLFVASVITGVVDAYVFP